MTVSNSCVSNFIPHRNLTGIHMNFCRSIIRGDPADTFLNMPYRLGHRQPESSFTTLRQLSLEEMNHYDIPALCTYIASILTQSPGLETLRLSLRERGGGEVCTDTFEDICREYQRLSDGDAPLSLKKLYLGKSIHLPPVGQLGSLIDLAVVERVQIGSDCKCKNRPVVDGVGQIVQTVRPFVSWEILNPATVPSM